MLETKSLIVILVVGLIAGWLAGKIVWGTGLGIIGDIIVGVLGAFIGRWLFTYFHFRVGVNFWIDAILTATVGAVVLLVVIRLIGGCSGRFAIPIFLSTFAIALFAVHNTGCRGRFNRRSP